MRPPKPTPEEWHLLWHLPLRHWLNSAAGGTQRRKLANVLASAKVYADAYAAGLADDGQHDDADGDGRALWEMTTAEAAARLGVSERTIRRHALAGHIRARKVGRVWLVDADAELPEEP